MEDKEFLWNMYNEHTAQARHHETQRTTVVTVVITLTGAVIAYLASIKTSVPHWPMSAFLVVLGLFGAGFSLKQTERTRLHMHIAGAYRKRLESELDKPAPDTLDPVPGIRAPVAGIRKTAEEEHNSQWFWLTGRDDKDKWNKRRAEKKKDREPLFHLYWFFIGLSALVIILGIVTWVVPI